MWEAVAMASGGWIWLQVRINALFYKMCADSAHISGVDMVSVVVEGEG